MQLKLSDILNDDRSSVKMRVHKLSKEMLPTTSENCHMSVNVYCKWAKVPSFGSATDSELVFAQLFSTH